MEALYSHSTQEQHAQARASKYRRVDQPADLINVDGALLKLETLARLSGLTVSTLYRSARRGELTLKKHGARCTRVRAEDARAYLARLSGAAQ